MKKQHFDIATRLADEITDIADIDLEEVSVHSCLMAAATFIVEGDLSVKKSIELLKKYVAIVKEKQE